MILKDRTIPKRAPPKTVNQRQIQSLQPCPHSDIKVVLHLELFQIAQRLQSGNVLHLVVTEVQVTKRRQLQVLGQLLQSVPREIPPLQGLETGQQPDWQVLELQPQSRQTEEQKASRQCSSKVGNQTAARTLSFQLNDNLI